MFSKFNAAYLTHDAATLKALCTDQFGAVRDPALVVNSARQRFSQATIRGAEVGSNEPSGVQILRYLEEPQVRLRSPVTTNIVALQARDAAHILLYLTSLVEAVAEEKLPRVDFAFDL